MQYRVLEGENIYMVAVKLCGSPDHALQLLSDNNLDFSSTLTGLTLTCNYTHIPEPFVFKEDIEEAASSTWYAHDGQTLYDIALMTEGLESLVSLLVKNNMDFSESINTKTPVNYNIKRDPIYSRIKEKNIVFNSGNNKFSSGYVDTFYVEEGYV